MNCLLTKFLVTTVFFGNTKSNFFVFHFKYLSPEHRNHDTNSKIFTFTSNKCEQTVLRTRLKINNWIIEALKTFWELMNYSNYNYLFVGFRGPLTFCYVREWRSGTKNTMQFILTLCELFVARKKFMLWGRIALTFNWLNFGF